MNGAKLVLECLKREKVNTLFGYPGGAVIPLYDALFDYKDDFVHIRGSHEQGIIHAADGYARATGKVGVGIVTSGPGATNAITAIATAYMDSSALVVISGQVGTALLGKDSFQEIDITGMTLSVTKHNYLLRNTREIAPTIKEAFKIAQSGRKGPVLIDIPKNLFTEEIDFNPFNDEYFSIDEKDYNIGFKEFTFEDIEKAIEMISNSKKPVIYAGGGIKSSNSFDELLEFATKQDIPVVNTLMGLSGIDRDNPLSLGLMGMHGFKEANFAVSKADLIIALGARFSDRGTGLTDSFAKDAKKIHIDIDKSEINKNIKTDLEIIGSSKIVLPLLTKNLEKKDRSKWKKEINSFKEESKIDKEIFHPKNILEVLNKAYEKEETILVTDVGQHQMWAAQYWNFKNGKNFITSGGLGTMGFGLGAAIGACVGKSEKKTILVTGDGSFRMNMNELATVNDYNLPIVIVLFNNNTLGMVRQWQKLFSNKRYSQTDIKANIDYKKLTDAFNIKSFEVNSIDNLKKILENYNNKEPIFIQCNIDKDFDVYPIVPPNDNLEHLIVG
ncbi:MAG: biosynthetic-type acetolactate synthase large subunit [Peptoniphilaceae bacterium]|nr:biosynthetic-type acetolactate synthase large subunit [Peptoniphilaceae bacterium]MDD7383744.1 biosynthetic-type acetolactate synthase large subunit [Peptoniphilaceae bacterium]MDY3737856.1 biosynthetic-type acetolactate synthase large subunit [Peptoniphilaceae bacterium]